MKMQPKEDGIRIITAGRRQLGDFFEKSDIRELKQRNHYPFLVFVADNETKIVEVFVIKSPLELLELPDDVQVMSQWQGKWRSDFFQYTVGDFRRYIEANPPTNYQVV